ncbi:hypothetical protein [Pseudomonas sp.]|uniref:hypothetical protein n=1 Tax=Pseudomonas sp. TaxID=306 RepID=UPI00272C36BB|nr:hypothetical protein [Pseudomonas sp.]
MLKPGPDGKLKLPLSTSPEIHNNSLKAWLTPNSNNDFSLLRWLFGALAEMAIAMGNGPATAAWHKVPNPTGHHAHLMPSDVSDGEGS